MENAWTYLRCNRLCVPVWNSYDDVPDACSHTWNFLVNDPNQIRSIGTRDWGTVSFQGGWYKMYSVMILVVD